MFRFSVEKRYRKGEIVLYWCARVLKVQLLLVYRVWDRTKILAAIIVQSRMLCYRSQKTAYNIIILLLCFWKTKLNVYT